MLGGLASSRLDNTLVKGEQLAVSVTAQVQQFAQIGIFEVTACTAFDQPAEARSGRACASAFHIA